MMTNFFGGHNDSFEKYAFVGDYVYGRRMVGICTNKMQYGVEINGEVVSPWFDFLLLMPNFNVCKKAGKSFLTSANGKEKISQDYAEIEKFVKVHGLGRYYAKVKGVDGFLGTISSEGKIGIECSQEELIRFGTAFAVCGKRINGQLKYGIRAVNGEKKTAYEYDEYKISGWKVYLKSENGIIVYDSVGGCRKV